jgi:chorismate synthase
MGGAVAKMVLHKIVPKMRVRSFARQIGPLVLSEKDLTVFGRSKKPYPADDFTARFPSRSQEASVEKLLRSAKDEGRSYGGFAEIWVDGLLAGLGQPVFHKLKADLAAAFLGVGATASVEIGSGLGAATAEGSEFHSRDDDEDRYGGIRGGITTGERLVARVGFKPTASVLDVAKKGRHDPCIIPRALPVLEAMTNLVLLDHVLWARGDRLAW